MSEKVWNFAKIPANFKIYDDFDDGDAAGWSISGNVIVNQNKQLDGTGYAVCLNPDFVGGGGKIYKDSLDYEAYDDLYLVVLVCCTSAEDDCLLITVKDVGGSTYTYSLGQGVVNEGDTNIVITMNVIYSFVFPISADFYSKNASILDLDMIEFNCSASDRQAYILWTGIFRSSAFSDDYCISCTCGTASNIDSGIRDCDDDDVYLKTINSDLTITEDINIGSGNSKLTIYYTLGAEMKLKVTISWEIGETPQTDKVLYATSGTSWEWDLSVECPDIDKITKIKAENVVG